MFRGWSESRTRQSRVAVCYLTARTSNHLQLHTTEDTPIVLELLATINQPLVAHDRPTIRWISMLDDNLCHRHIESIQCFVPKLSASLGLYLIFYKKLTLALLIGWLDKYLPRLYRIFLVGVITIALVAFRTSLTRTMCYVVIIVLIIKKCHSNHIASWVNIMLPICPINIITCTLSLY